MADHDDHDNLINSVLGDDSTGNVTMSAEQFSELKSLVGQSQQQPQGDDTRSKLLAALTANPDATPNGRSPAPRSPMGGPAMSSHGNPDMYRTREGLLNIWDDNVASMLDDDQLKGEFERGVMAQRRKSGAPPLPTALRRIQEKRR